MVVVAVVVLFYSMKLSLSQGPQTEQLCVVCSRFAWHTHTHSLNTVPVKTVNSGSGLWLAAAAAAAAHRSLI